MSGLLCRYKLSREGQRQIMSFHVPGDMPDLQSLFLKTMDHSLCTLTDSVIFQMPHAELLQVIKEHPGIGILLWRNTLIEAAIFREWMKPSGQLNGRSAGVRTSAFRSVVRAARCAVDQKPVHLICLRVQQHSATAAAGVVDRMALAMSTGGALNTCPTAGAGISFRLTRG
jgi:hypothetical protein